MPLGSIGNSVGSPSLQNYANNGKKYGNSVPWVPHLTQSSWLTQETLWLVSATRDPRTDTVDPPVKTVGPWLIQEACPVYQPVYRPQCGKFHVIDLLDVDLFSIADGPSKLVSAPI